MTPPVLPPPRGRRAGLAGAALAATLLLGGCREREPRPAAGPPPTDLEGRPVAPLDPHAGRLTVLLFVSTDCPISNRYAPEYRRLHEEFTPRGARFWLIYPNEDDTADAIRRHTNEFQLPLPVARDPGHALVRRGRAGVTPEAAVFLADGRLTYHGRIDNRPAAPGRERPAATRHDLREALAAALAGRPPPRASAPAVGCRLEPPRGG